LENVQYCFLSHLSGEKITDIISKQKTRWLSDGINGKSYGNQLELYYHNGSYRNSWNPIFYGTLSENQDGTIIAGSFKTPLYAEIFIWIWRAMTILFTIFMLIIFFISSKNMSILLASIVPISMFLFSFLLVRIGENMGQENISNVLQFIENGLNAAPLVKN